MATRECHKTKLQFRVFIYLLGNGCYVISCHGARRSFCHHQMNDVDQATYCPHILMVLIKADSQGSQIWVKNVSYWHQMGHISVVGAKI